MTEIVAISWWPALITVAVGVVLGLVQTRGRRRENTSETADLTNLETRRDELIRLLQTEVDSGTVYERERLETELAGTLRAIDDSDPIAEASTDREPPAPARTPSQFTGFAWGFGSMAVIAAIVIGAMSSSSPRQEGEGLTGGAEGMTSPMTAPPRREVNDPRVVELRSQIEASPENIDLRLMLAERLLAARDLVSVHEQTEFILEREPDNPFALSYSAIVRLAMGQTGVAIEMLQRAVASDPSLLEPRIHLAIALFQTGRVDQARETLEEAIKRHPEQSQMLNQLLDELSSPPPVQ